MIIVLIYFLLSMTGFILFANLQLDRTKGKALDARHEGAVHIGTGHRVAVHEGSGNIGAGHIGAGHIGAGNIGAQEVKHSISVIIPARNEEKSLPNLLRSLKEQTLQPDEIIVVDDFSSDRTREIAEEYPVRIVSNPPLPEGWTGKNWTVWNGYLHSTGEILVFLDADVRLAPNALYSLIATRERCGGAISVIPYHHMEKFYERFSMVLNILGLLVFTSPFERKSDTHGLYGSCIVAARSDYAKIKGHSGVRSEIMDDLSLGKRFSESGIPVNNFLGMDQVSYRMYPGGLRSEIEGFGKGAISGMNAMQHSTICLVAMWVVGLVTIEILTPLILILGRTSARWFLVSYLIYTVQIFYFVKYTGNYKALIPVFHGLSSLFMIYIMLYSHYRLNIVGSIPWKGRQVHAGGGQNQ